MSQKTLNEGYACTKSIKIRRAGNCRCLNPFIKHSMDLLSEFVVLTFAKYHLSGVNNVLVGQAEVDFPAHDALCLLLMCGLEEESGAWIPLTM